MQRGKTRTLDRKMSTRWLHEIGLPGRPDTSSIYASYAFAGILASSLLLARLTNFWPWFTLGMLSIGFQIPLLIGIGLAKFRTSLPETAGHAKMFPHPEPFKDIGWLRAFGGFMTSAAIVALFALYERTVAV
jgi:hypothetical protein